jgi:hypothetical protein
MGMIENPATGDCYLVFLYKTRDYAGELIADMEEGRHFWMRPEELTAQAAHNENSFALYLPIYFCQGYVVNE